VKYFRNIKYLANVMKQYRFLPELEDQKWFPDILRRNMLDYLRFVLTKFNLYEPIIPLLQHALSVTKDNTIVDLCSGGGGAMPQIHQNLQNFDPSVKIILSDLFPNVEAYEWIARQSDNAISFHAAPVDAAAVPHQLQGFRTVFSAIHHFSPDAVKAVLRDAVTAKAGIGIFDGGDRDLKTFLTMPLVHPIIFLFATPLLRPFRFSRLLLTYVLPLIPLCTIWDGMVSILRLYAPDELLALAHQVESVGYEWQAGKKRNRLGMNVAYLIGYPRK
jgi:hypothetical protein